MKVFSITSPAFCEATAFFKETAPNDVQLVLEDMVQGGSPALCSEFWYQVIERKFQILLDAIGAVMDDNPDEIMAWVDADCQFFGPVFEAMKECLGPMDIAFQMENGKETHINSGVMVFRANHKVYNLFAKVLDYGIRIGGNGDQTVINHLMRRENRGEVSWTYLDWRFWTQTAVSVGNLETPTKILLHHANGTSVPNPVPEKVKILNAMRRYLISKEVPHIPKPKL